MKYLDDLVLTLKTLSWLGSFDGIISQIGGIYLDKYFNTYERFDTSMMPNFFFEKVNSKVRSYNSIVSNCEKCTDIITSYNAYFMIANNYDSDEALKCIVGIFNTTLLNNVSLTGATSDKLEILNIALKGQNKDNVDLIVSKFIELNVFMVSFDIIETICGNCDCNPCKNC